MKDLQKGFVLPVLLIIIAMIVAGGAGYLYLNKNQSTLIPPSPIVSTASTSTTQSTSEPWQVYSLQGIQIPYQTSWSMDPAGAKDGDTAPGIDFGVKGPTSNEAFSMSIRFHTEPSFGGPNQYIAQFPGWFSAAGTINLTNLHTVAYAYISTPEFEKLSDPGQTYLIQTNGGWLEIEIHFYSKPPRNAADLQIISDFLNKIHLSTETATPSTTSIASTSAWKTYTNTEQGFSIQYPPYLFPNTHAQFPDNAIVKFDYIKPPEHDAEWCGIQRSPVSGQSQEEIAAAVRNPQNPIYEQNSSYYKDSIIKNISTGGFDGVLALVPGFGYSYYFFFQSNQGTLDLTGAVAGENDTLCDQMLKTLKKL